MQVLPVATAQLELPALPVLRALAASSVPAVSPALLAPRELVVSKVPKVTRDRLALLVSPAKLAPSVLPAPRVLVALLDLAVSKVARFSEQDRADIRALGAEGFFSAEEFRVHALEAMCDFIGDKRVLMLSLDLIARDSAR